MSNSNFKSQRTVPSATAEAYYAGRHGLLRYEQSTGTLYVLLIEVPYSICITTSPSPIFAYGLSLFRQGHLPLGPDELGLEAPGSRRCDFTLLYDSLDQALQPYRKPSNGLGIMVGPERGFFKQPPGRIRFCPQGGWMSSTPNISNLLSLVSMTALDTLWALES